MTLILLEALAALLIFVGIIWWTMFSGRPKGELPESNTQARAQTDSDTPADGESSLPKIKALPPRGE